MQVRDRRTPSGGNFYQLLVPSSPTGGRELTAIADADNAEVIYRTTSDLHGSAREYRRTTALRDLEDRRRRINRDTTPAEALEKLSDYGFAWRDIARVLGVSVPAVTKWRKQGGVTGENMLKLAKLLALVEMLESRLIADPASWLEMPIRDGVALCPMDLIAAGRYELALEYASEYTGENTVDQVLTEYDPEWRSNLVDDAFETYVAADGVVSIRPRGAAH